MLLALAKSGEALPSTVLRRKVSVVLSTRPVCLPSWKLEWGTCQLGGIRSVVYDEDRLWWQMRNQFLLDPLEEVVAFFPLFVFCHIR